MKILNLSESTVYLDDIGLAVMYNRENSPTEVEDSLAKRSKNLRWAIREGLLLDVTDGIPKVIPKPRAQQTYASPKPPENILSPFRKRQNLLVDDKPKVDESGSSPEKEENNRLTTSTDNAGEQHKKDGTMSVVWTGPACFLEHAQVLTKEGIVTISDIRIGKEVFTHKGRARLVTDVFKRPYDGEIIGIKTFLDSEEVELTSEHIVFAVRGHICNHGRGRVCRPNCKSQNITVYGPYGKGEYPYCSKPYRSYQIEKIRAEDLTENDFLVLPRQKPTLTLKEIKISEYLGNYSNFSEDGNGIWPSTSPGKTYKTTVARRLGMSISNVYHIEKLGKEKKEKLTKALLEAGNKPPVYDPLRKDYKVPLFYDLDFDFGELLGFYVAEGSASRKGLINFSLHEDEKEYQDSIQKLINKIIGIPSKIRPESGKKAVAINFNCSIWSNFLRECCGTKAIYKRIPSFLFDADDKTVSGFIQGLWSGDGCKNPRKKDNTIKYGTSSPSLAYGLRFLLSRFGVTASIRSEIRTRFNAGQKSYTYDRPKISYLVIISGQQLYENEWLSKFSFNRKPHDLIRASRQRNHFSDGDYSYVKIMGIKKRRHVGQVYNIEVEDDHSYLVNGKAFKNCDAGGFANMNRQFMFGLSQKGIRVKYEALVSMNDMDQKTRGKIANLEAVQVPNDAPKVYGMTAPLIYSWDRYKLLFTMMETRRLHKDYVERCNCADEIVVPTNWCKDVFLESGVKVPIEVVPLGVDTSIYRPDAEPLGFTANLRDFVFLSVFGWSLRKGYDVLLKAYLEEFTSDEPVSLLISSRYFGSTDESKKKVIRDDIARVSSTVSNPKKPHLVLFGDALSVETMPRLYASSDCYVIFTRGEGFCMPVVEAAACGLPCIATRYSGQTDFMSDDNSYLVDIDSFRRAGPELSWISYFYENQEFPTLGPSVVEQARVAMRRAYENREEAKEKAGRLHDKVVTEYNWERCVSLMHDKLKRTFERLEDWKCKRNPSS